MTESQWMLIALLAVGWYLAREAPAASSSAKPKQVTPPTQAAPLVGLPGWDVIKFGN